MVAVATRWSSSEYGLSPFSQDGALSATGRWLSPKRYSAPRSRGERLSTNQTSRGPCYRGLLDPISKREGSMTMKNHTLFLLTVLVVAAAPALGQKIEAQAPGSVTITRVETALNHLTVIELSEPVMSVAAGSQAFKVEWRENKVFVETTEAHVSAHLFIWAK